MSDDIIFDMMKQACYVPQGSVFDNLPHSFYYAGFSIIYDKSNPGVFRVELPQSSRALMDKEKVEAMLGHIASGIQTANYEFDKANGLDFEPL